MTAMKRSASLTPAFLSGFYADTADVEREFDGKGYGEFKPAVGEAVVDVLRPLQERVADLEKDKAYIDGIIKNNAEKAQYYSNKTLRKVQKKIGFPERIR